jgi:putative phosphoesterase
MESIKIVVISDNHRDYESLLKVSLIEPDIDYYLHIGDSELEESKLYPFIGVKGNCDCFNNLPKEKIIKTEFGNVYLVHHLSQIPLSDEFIWKNNIRIVLFGHTHKRFLQIINGVYYANPGSLTYPRDDHGPSYLLVTLSEKNMDFTFKNI